MRRWLRSQLRLTIRVRLTLLYGASFLLAGTVLVAIMYLLVRNQLQARSAGRILEPTGLPTGPVLGPTPASSELPQDRVFVERVNEFVQQSLTNLLWQSVAVLACAALLAVGLGWVLAGRALAPLQEVTQTARRVSARGLHERIGMKGDDDEIHQLADTFDAMLDRLDRAFDAQRHFVSNASHELRTPLAINRTLLEVAAADPEASDDVRRLAKPLLATNARSEGLIEGLLLLARSEQPVANGTTVDLADVTTTALQLTAAEAQQRDVCVRSAISPADTTGEPVLLERLAVNLIQNAIRHNVPGGSVEVTTGQRDGCALLTIQNTGPVVPPKEVESLFEPFRRGSGRTVSDGVGLGLSIVRAIATAHGGRVEAAANVDGGGLAVRVTLPLHRAGDGAAHASQATVAEPDVT